MTLEIRAKYQRTINELTDSVSHLDEQFTRTGDPNFAKFRDDNIRTLRDLKEFILRQEREAKYTQLDLWGDIEWYDMENEI